MISHEHRCIFIHIPRCAGTSVEQWLCGKDWWDVDKPTKHLTASQARLRYEKWWIEYFKFAIVRDPYTRAPSLLKFSRHFGLRREDDGPIDFSGYERLFGHGYTLEHDHRFAERATLERFKHQPGRVYSNILDEEIDFIAKFENLPQDMAFAQEMLGVTKPFDHHAEQTTKPHAPLLPEDKEWIAATYAGDFARFGYER